MFPMDAPNLAQIVETALLESREAAVVKLVEWKSESRWIGDDAELLAFLLTRYGRFLGTDDYDDFGPQLRRHLLAPLVTL